MKKILALGLFITALTFPVSAQVTISDFSSGPGGVNFTGGLGSWTNGTDQFTTSGGILTVGPVSGGNPDNSGYFSYADVAGSVTINATALNLTQLSVTARLDSGNLAPGVLVIFYDSGGAGALFGTLVADGVSPNSFTSAGFTTQTVTLSAHANNGVVSDITSFGISGSGTGAAFRMSFDTITLSSAVPEPSTYAIFAGVFALGFVAWRRRVIRN